MDLIFFGMQGSGKGTLGKFIAEKYDLKIFEMGAELRKLAQEDSELAHRVKAIIESGQLVSDEVVMEIVENFMKNLEEGLNILFDGIPRKVSQAQLLNKVLSRHNRFYTGVYLKIAQDTALTRLTTRRVCEVCKAVYPVTFTNETCECGGKLITRSDDNPEAIKTRLEAFQKETIPAIELYKNNLIEIDGEPDIDKVRQLAVEKLDPSFATCPPKA